MSTPLFLDLTGLTPRATDDALEYIYKAGSGHRHDDDIWRPHESVLIRRLIELFSQRGLDRLEQVRTQIIAWESGAYHKPGHVPASQPGMMQRWGSDEMALARIYLESLPPDQWTIDDHMMAVDLVVQRYLPEDDMRTEAEWLSTRAGLMGTVQANLDKPPSEKQADIILAALPSTVQGARYAFPSLTPLQKSVLEFGKARCAENVRHLAESVRHRMRGVIMQRQEESMTMAPGANRQSLESKLFDEFAVLNRDWRRIAVTEAGENQTVGYIASLEVGTKVQRVEQYANACSFCKKIDGVIAEVVPPDAKDKDPDTQIWVGKNNIGRSASPRKRVGSMLVERTPEEMWWLPAGLAHPHCRGRWVPVIKDEPHHDADFGDWLRATLGAS